MMGVLLAAFLSVFAFLSQLQVGVFAQWVNEQTCHTFWITRKTKYQSRQSSQQLIDKVCRKIANEVDYI